MTSINGTWTLPPDAPDVLPAIPPDAPTETMIVPGPDGIVDFTEPHKTVRFRIDADVFELIPALPALGLMEFGNLAGLEPDNPEQARETFKQMFRLILDDESAERFIPRLSDRKHPITVDQVNKVVPYIMEQLGLRPTEPSEPSSDGSGSPASGPNLTVNAPLPESTSAEWTDQPSLTTSTGS